MLPRTIACATLMLMTACSGSSWVAHSLPGASGIAANTLWVFGERDVWVGGSSLWHYDGDAFVETPPPSRTYIAKLFGFAPDDLWAVGSDKALHWDGSSWSDRSPQTVGGFNALSAIWGVSSDDLWIANSDNSRLFHFDGQKWSRTVLQFVQANALWGSSSSDIWLVGLSDPYHYDGTSWTQHDGDHASPSHATGLWGAGASDVWAVGGTAEIAHWDGSAWSGFDDVDGTYHAVWGASADDVLAVGNFGFLARYDGSRWSEERSDSTGNLAAIHGSSASNVWAVAIDLTSQSTSVLRLSR